MSRALSYHLAIAIAAVIAPLAVIVAAPAVADEDELDNDPVHPAVPFIVGPPIGEVIGDAPQPKEEEANCLEKEAATCDMNDPSQSIRPTINIPRP